MAKIVKRTTKRRINIQSVTVLMVLFTSMVYLCSSLFLRSYNVSLSKETQQIKNEIAALTTENESVKVEIQNLSTRDRVTTMAQQDGMTLNQGNIFTIAD